MYEAERNKARNIPIDGEYPDFAKAVRYLLGWSEDSDRPYLSTRAAQSKTGVNFTTISMAARGFRGKEDTVKKIAVGLGGDVDELLLLADYVPKGRREELRSWTDSIITDPPYDPSREITGSYDPDDVYVAAQDNGMSPADAKKLLTRLEEIRKEKARRQGREE